MNQGIGENAGKIWSYLQDNGDVSVANLKKDLDLKGDQAGLALGWLAREGKLDFEKKGASVKVKLL